MVETEPRGGRAAPPGVTWAVVLATSPAALTVVGGLTLAVRAVLVLRELGITDVTVVAGAAQQPVAEALLARRGLEAGTGLDAACDPSGAECVLVVAGDVVFEGPVLGPLLAAAQPGQCRVAWHPGDAPGHVRVALCPRARIPALVAQLRTGAGTLAGPSRASASPPRRPCG